jgi:hypothetical protein
MGRLASQLCHSSRICRRGRHVSMSVWAGSHPWVQVAEVARFVYQGTMRKSQRYNLCGTTELPMTLMWKTRETPGPSLISGRDGRFKNDNDGTTSDG